MKWERQREKKTAAATDMSVQIYRWAHLQYTTPNDTKWMLDLKVAKQQQQAQSTCITHLRHSDERFWIGIVRSLPHESHYSSKGEDGWTKERTGEVCVSRTHTLAYKCIKLVVCIRFGIGSVHPVHSFLLCSPLFWSTMSEWMTIVTGSSPACSWNNALC